jgi:type II secretion system protein D
VTGHATAPATQPASVGQDVGTLSGQPVEVQATSSGDVIISTMNDQDMEILTRLIEELDRLPEGAERTARVFPLESAQASELAPVLQRFWNEYKKPVSGQIPPEDQLTIMADPRTNVLIIAAAEDAMPEVAELIENLDKPAFGDEGMLQFTGIPLKHIQAAEAAEKISELLETIQRQRGVSRELVNIKPDVRTNRLLVTASEADLEQIRSLVDLIDIPPSPESGSVVEVAFVPLKKAVARELADALNEMLEAQTDVGKALQQQIRQLQIHLVEEDRNLSPVNLERPIKIYAEPGTNSLVVATVESNMEPLLEVIRLLDSLPTADDVMIRIFPLKYADAETLRDNVERIFAAGDNITTVPGKEAVKGRVPPTVESGLVYNIGLVADKRTNSLVVSGRPEQLLLVRQIVDAVDVAEEANRFPVRMVRLEHADCRRIADVAQELADQREDIASKYGEVAAERERILLIPDVRTNSLIVVANDINFEEIQDLARRLDGAEPDWLGDIRIISLDEPLVASDLESKITDLWARRADLRREADLPEDLPVIVTDSRSNSLVIASNREDFEAIQHLIEQLKAQPLSPMMDIYHLRVEHHAAADLAEILQTLLDERLQQSLAKGEEEQPSDRVHIMDDPLTNTLLIVASKANYQGIVELVSQLDVPPPVEGIIRTFPVRNIDVTRAQELIEEMFDKGIYRTSAGNRELPESMTEVTVVADVRSSLLIVSASPENYTIIKALLDEIDRVDVPLATGEARFFQIENADVVNVADLLEQMLEGIGSTIGEGGEQLEYTVIPETRGDRLIVVGSREAIRRAEALVPQLDVARTAPITQVKVYALKEASAAQLAQVMSDLFDELDSDEGGRRMPVLILPAETSNSLIVTAGPEDHQMAEHLIGLLDKPSSLDKQMEIIPLAEAKADTIAEALSDLLDQQQSDYQGGYAITPEMRTNSLVVWAAPDLMNHIKRIAGELDNARPKAEYALRVKKLYNAKAEDLADLLNQFFEDAGATDGDAGKQMIINFIAGTHPETGGSIVERLVHQDVTIAPDPNTNALLIMAPEDSVDMVEMLISMLDNVEPTTVSVRVFELQKADATAMQDLLEELFAPEGQDGESRQIAIGEGGGVTLAGGGTGRAMELSFAVDERTNTLLAAGSPAQLHQVETLVYRLDRQEGDERINRVIRLRYRKASDVAGTLREFIDENTSLLEEAAGDQESAARQLERRVTVTEAAQEDTESSTILVSYSPRMESEVIRMINELDQPVPQVMIQVLMAEVTLNDNFELGMEWAAQDLLFSEHAVINPNTGQPQGADWDFTLGTDIGAAGSGGLGGISFTMGGEDFAFLFRALQSEGRVEVLSRPQIMVQDGQEANIEIGEDVPTVTSVVVSTGGVVTPSVTYNGVGIKLRVLPIINPDGYVNMEIEPEISSIAQSSVSIGAGVTLPIFTKRTATTKVTVKDSETIIIGGLITSRTNDSDNRVPFAGDIPILGNLFRSQARSNTRTELLIVLTPHVIRVADDARELSLKLRDESGMNDNIRHSPLMQGLQVKPQGDAWGPDATIYLPDRASDTATVPLSPPDGEEMGPELEEFGPATETIRLGPAEPAVAVLPE